MRKQEKYLPMLPVLGLYAVLLGVGLASPGHWQMIAQLAFYCALGQAFNIFMGMTGYVNFGYVVFLGVGTYGMALTIDKLYYTHLGLALLPIGFLAGSLFAVLVALTVGGVALRLRGAYFAIATIGVNEGLRYLIEGARLFGGSDGIIFSSHLRKAMGRSLASSLSTFWADIIVFALAVLTAWLTLVFIRSKVGYALTALREDEDAAKVMGIHVTRYKMLAFLASAALAGILGAAAWALKLTYVYPDDVFEISYTVEAIIIVVLGGSGTLLGPVVGGIIYGLAKYFLSIILPGFQLLIFAPLILVVIVMFPEGAVGVLRRKLVGTRFEKFIV